MSVDMRTLVRMQMLTYARGKIKSSFANTADITVSAPTFANNARTELTRDRIYGTEQITDFEGRENEFDV